MNLITEFDIGEMDQRWDHELNCFVEFCLFLLDS